MSLKGFHIIFIICSIVLSIGFAYWAFTQYTHAQTIGYLVTTIASALATIGLIAYEWRFVRKIKV